MADTRSDVAAVDDRYAEVASWEIWLTPKPPYLMGSVACNQALLFWIRAVLVIELRMERRVKSYLSR